MQPRRTFAVQTLIGCPSLQGAFNRELRRGSERVLAELWVQNAATVRRLGNDSDSRGNRAHLADLAASLLVDCLFISKGKTTRAGLMKISRSINRDTAEGSCAVADAIGIRRVKCEERIATCVY